MFYYNFFCTTFVLTGLQKPPFFPSQFNRLFSKCCTSKRLFGNNLLGHVIRKHCLGHRNDNGGKFVDFGSFHHLIIGGTLFGHRVCHKAIRSTNLRSTVDLGVVVWMYIRRNALTSACKASPSEGHIRSLACCP